MEFIIRYIPTLGLAGIVIALIIAILVLYFILRIFVSSDVATGFMTGFLLGLLIGIPVGLIFVWLGAGSLSQMFLGNVSWTPFLYGCGATALITGIINAIKEK